jgi:hypothetical protein
MPILRKIMKLSEFRQNYEDVAVGALASISAALEFMTNKNKDAKSYREEQTPILAYCNLFKLPESTNIELGGEACDFDAIISKEGDGSTRTLEVVQASSTDFHKTREFIAGERLVQTPEEIHEKVKQEPTAEKLADAIVAAINKKISKNYGDTRTLIVSISGEETHEDDKLILASIDLVKSKIGSNKFDGIYLVELSRRKCFEINMQNIKY